MKRNFIHILTLTCVMAAAGIVRAQDTNAPVETNAAPASTAPALDFKSFDIIATRNIFDPTRTGPQPERRIVRPPRVDWFTLAGTMSYEKGHFAFFDSNRSQYKKTLQVSDMIAGYKIADIATSGVKLAAGSNQTINLPVGAQMRRIENGRWTYLGHAEPVADTPSETSVATTSDAASTTSTSAVAPEAPPSGAESDIMKRLMLKRLQEK